ncbi:proline-responsive transcriptional activator PutR [Lederbergia ruris]|uniref:Proline-responsive transcriptional activator PutR n=1 Tax=Lederbergia ruris TaxID=217495 RepID=A0ABQ4KHF2_9BACI|nr:helix-turn-helix domain-containing protein [Lederbergia ruris]GIN57378.1 proline-responsive transcriptional activator PutR [Lederbergia ruris]
MDRLLEKVQSLTNLNEITDIMSAHLKMPIVMEDDQFSLLAYSSFYIDHFDEVNRQTIFTKHWPLSILEKFMEKGIVDKLKTNPEPFRVEPLREIGLNQRIVVSAKYNDQILGYIWIQETDRQLKDTEIDFLQAVSFHVGQLLYQQKKLKWKKEQEKSSFYKRVMDDMFQTEAQLKWEAANLNISLPDVFTTVVFTVNSARKDESDKLLEKVELFANSLPFQVEVFIDQLKITVILGYKHPSSKNLIDCARELTAAVFSQFSNRSVFYGISNEYSSILLLKKSYQEALEVIKIAKFIGPTTLPTYEYGRLGIFRYLESISQYHKKWNDVNENLLKLKQKDKESQTRLLQTLEVFLSQNCRLKPTAEKLFIHPNTLKYRLNQITELTSITFDNFQENCQLYIDLQLLKVDLID